MVSEERGQVVVAPEIGEALERWRRRVFGAPRDFLALVTATEVRDEVLYRVLTDVVRRDLVEERGVTTQLDLTRPRIPLAQIDPFAGDSQVLRNDTLHVAGCLSCSATGLVRCTGCGGRKAVACRGCGGAGKIRNPQTNRLNKCKACQGSGAVACGQCRGSGSVACTTCRGSGRQSVWLIYKESRRPRVVVHPQTPVVVAHRQLGEPRILAGKDVASFTVVAEAHAQGPLGSDGLSAESSAIVQHELAKVDARLERVVWQQCMVLSVIRRDVTYQMCGTTGKVALSGTPMSGASTGEAIRPIRRRLLLWPILVVGLGLVGMVVAGSAMGKSAYFEASNKLTGMLWLGALIASVPWVGGVLRAWRPSIRVRGLRAVEMGLAGVWAALLLAIALVGVVNRPEASAVEEALAAADIERARVILDALIEREGDSGSVAELEDGVLMAEAEATTGDARLAKLDAVVSHRGSRAVEAAALARADRLAGIRDLNAAGRPDNAIAAIDRDFATTWREDLEVAEQRALAHEQRAKRCSDDPCRFLAGRAAQEARETPARVETLETLRKNLLSEVSIEHDLASMAGVERVRTIDDVAESATRILAAELGDSSLSTAAKAAKGWAAEERAKVPMLGADVDTLRALFPKLHASSAVLASVSVEGAEMFFSLDAEGRCGGVYAVGPAGHRELNAQEWSAKQILSQALGQPLVLAPTKEGTDISSAWKEGKTKIVARWRGGVPVELRIGDAAP